MGRNGITGEVLSIVEVHAYDFDLFVHVRTSSVHFFFPHRNLYHQQSSGPRDQFRSSALVFRRVPSLHSERY